MLLSRLVLAGLLWVMPVGAWGAVAHDATTTFTATNATSVSGSHTPVSTTNGIAEICVSWQRSPLGTLDSVTYNGSAATLVAGVNEGFTGTRRVELWRYIGPPSGASTVTATFDATKNDMRMHVSTYTGVDQTTPHGTAVTASGTSTTASVTVTSAAGELVIDCAMTANSAAVATVGAGQTQRANFGDATNHLHLGSEEAGAASTVMSWTFTADGWGTIGVPLKPVSAAATVCRRMMLGVGC